jgi:large-conductance mechanosensitive channel
MNRRLQKFVSSVSSSIIAAIIISLVVASGLLGSLAIWLRRLTAFERGFVCALAIVLLMLAVAVFFILSPASGHDSKRSTKRIVVTVAPEYLWDQFQERTHSQAQKLMEVYRGKWLRVAGDLDDFRSNMASIRYRDPRNPDSLSRGIMMFFRDKPTLAMLDGFPRGMRIEVMGKITQIEAFTITLDRCELLPQSGGELGASS